LGSEIHRAGGWVKVYSMAPKKLLKWKLLYNWGDIEEYN
jgi:hypothetical protein